MKTLNTHLNKKGFKASLSVRPSENLRSIQLHPINPITSGWGIVFHGKITNKKTLGFLIKNIQAVRLVSQDIAVVVSVYEDEFYLDLQNEVLGLDVAIIKCRDVGELGVPFPKSLCQQIETISSGLDYLKKINSVKCMKVRVDQHIDFGITLSLLEKLFSAFPSHSADTLNRIWTTSYNSYLKRPLGASDMFMAGYTQDVAEYWSKISTTEWLEFTNKLNHSYPHPGYQGFRIPEIWLGARYLDGKGEDLTSPDSANYIFWCNYMGVINSAHLNFFWLKTFDWLGSNFHTVNWFSSFLNEMHSEITFEDWIAIYSRK